MGFGGGLGLPFLSRRRLQLAARFTAALTESSSHPSSHRGPTLSNWDQTFANRNSLPFYYLKQIFTIMAKAGGVVPTRANGNSTAPLGPRGISRNDSGRSRKGSRPGVGCSGGRAGALVLEQTLRDGNGPWCLYVPRCIAGD